MEGYPGHRKIDKAMMLVGTLAVTATLSGWAVNSIQSNHSRSPDAHTLVLKGEIFPPFPGMDTARAITMPTGEGKPVENSP